MTLKNKKILVTGADGFIGSHLVEQLVEEGCRVKAFVYYNSNNSWGWLENIPGNMLSEIEVVAGDVRDADFVRKTTENVDIVFHLAAIISIPYSYAAPESFVDTNIKGTLNILQAARLASCERILITSTSEVYGTARYVPIDEKHPLQAQSPYAATKIGADRIAESFYRSYDMPLTIVRPFNTYGPRQSARAVIPTVITQLLSGKRKIRIGSLSPTRDFNYVKDTVRGFIEIARSDQTIGEEINIASCKEISIGDLINLLIELTGIEAELEVDEARLRPEKSEVMRLLGDNKKIRRLTKWEPRYDIRKGLKETIEWFRIKNNLTYYKSDIYNV